MKSEADRQQQQSAYEKRKNECRNGALAALTEQSGKTHIERPSRNRDDDGPCNRREKILRDKVGKNDKPSGQQGPIDRPRAGVLRQRGFLDGSHITPRVISAKGAEAAALRPTGETQSGSRPGRRAIARHIFKPVELEV